MPDSVEAAGFLTCLVEDDEGDCVSVCEHRVVGGSARQISKQRKRRERRRIISPCYARLLAEVGGSICRELEVHPDFGFHSDGFVFKQVRAILPLFYRIQGSL